MGEAIQSEHRAMMNDVAHSLDLIFNGGGPKRIGFCLFLAEIGKVEGGRVNYISNADRDDMLAMVKEWLALIEGRYVEGGRA